MAARAEAGAAEGTKPLGAVLTLSEAAWASGLARADLEAAVAAGEIPVARVVRGGRAVPVVSLADLEALHRRAAGAARASADERSALRERVARLEGELAASERVERSLQRYADRLEERSAERARELEAALAESRRREMTLARALGRAEALAARGPAALEAGRPARRRKG